ncbi:MAG: FKBP-type peptidyl-prolyl cis-trans isomerase [Candidatus Falkowbacteria bacterium]
MKKIITITLLGLALAASVQAVTKPAGPERVERAVPKKALTPAEIDKQITVLQQKMAAEIKALQLKYQPQIAALQKQLINGKLNIITLKAGKGAGAKTGDKVTVHYTGTLTDGSKFDSSLDRGQPFVFNLGAGQVIAGWDQGLLGMKVGEKRKLYIPASLGYGDNGVGPIPPKSTLIFEVELLKIN